MGLPSERHYFYAIRCADRDCSRVEAAYMAGALLAAGTDTTAASSMIMMLAAIHCKQM